MPQHSQDQIDIFLGLAFLLLSEILDPELGGGFESDLLFSEISDSDLYPEPRSEPDFLNPACYFLKFWTPSLSSHVSISTAPPASP